MMLRCPRCSHIYFCWQNEYVLYIVLLRKGAVEVMPMSCCTFNYKNKWDAGIGFYTIPAKQERSMAEGHFTNRVGGKIDLPSLQWTFVSGRPFRDPKNVDYIPTLFKDGKRKQLQYTQSKQGRKKHEDGEDILMVAVGLLNF